jgi:cellobiose-specific phosphotransferase system component IIA
MSEPTIICPKCKNEIKLTESLAAPLIESTRREYERRLAQKDVDLAEREKSVRDGEEDLPKAKDVLENQIEERLKGQRAKITAEEAKKAKLALGADLSQKTSEIADLQEILKQRDAKLAEAQKAQTDLLKK